MSKPWDAIGIGAGIAGAAAARELSRAGRRVLVLDRETPGAEASGAAAGMLAPQIEATHDDAGLPLGLAARDCYPGLIQELAARGHPVAFHHSGILMVAFDAERVTALQAIIASQRGMGLDADWLDGAELRRRQPGAGPEALGAMLAPHDGSVDNIALCAALAADAAQHGAVLERAAVSEVVTRGSRVHGVRTAERLHEAPVVVLAAGAWSPLIEGLPRRLPIEPVRGQMAAVPWPKGLPRTVLFGRGAYVVPRGRDAVLGSTMESVGFDRSTTAEGLAHIRAETNRILPALAAAPLGRTWSGFRPLTPDHRPILGMDPDVAGLVYDTGHGRNGILLGPLCGRIVHDLIVQGETRWDLAPYRVTRF
ncbi:MAG: glycine oxidase ThiO [Gemmatimonadetes bacterium GWC2_71_10]|nr:MAG: glycine oxidase ThiO [Gemmatimonadetes bacterium GWC2_71_10]